MNGKQMSLEQIAGCETTSIEPHKTKKNEKIRKEQKGEERNRTPFLFFVVILSSETVILPLAKLTGT